ncbi:MAG: sigma-54-dependent Fis family transcriptional regulator, partial [Deltaproteobacteria bacterium]|nr:sigma-54-dependent Fis family transcriptional regulator [Deltaproteobacteria bacterium]
FKNSQEKKQKPPEEKSMNQDHSLNTQELEKILELNQELNTAKDTKDILEKIMDSAIQLTGAKRGFLILTGLDFLNPGKKHIEVARHYDRKSLSAEEQKLSNSLINHVLKDKKVLLSANAQKEKDFALYQSVQLLKVKSILVTPLSWKKKIVGVLYLDNAHSAHLFKKHHITLLKILSELAITALNHGKIFEKLKSKHLKTLEEKRVLKIQVSQKSQEIEAIQQELEKAKTHSEEILSYADMIGRSEAMRSVFRLIKKVADTKIPVIIYGESGTGKELVARALHEKSSRVNQVFVSENCSAIPEQLLESELFGHQKGAFTGADRNKEGLFQYASQGTLFLDEIGDMPLKLQPKLLRVLQEEAVRPLGSKTITKINTRIIAASHQNLKDLISKRHFRQDLYYRLNGITINLPPLRERREDIPLLIQHFLKKHSSGKVATIKPQAIKILMQYNWPGNIRELENTLRNAIIFCEGNLIEEKTLHFKEELFEKNQNNQPVDSLKQKPNLETEKERILRALKATHNHKSRTAELLGLSRKTLYNKIEQYQLYDFIRQS